MFGSISFCIGDKCIEINGKKLSLGDLTTEFLNLPKDEYAAMRKQLELAESKSDKYTQSKQLSDWFEANKAFGYERFDYLYSEDTLPEKDRMILTRQKICEFFKEG